MITFDKNEYKIKTKEYNHKISSCWDPNETDNENFYRGFRNMPMFFLSEKLNINEAFSLFLKRINKIKELISEDCKIISCDFYEIIIYNENSNYAILLSDFLRDYLKISLTSKSETTLNENIRPFKEDKNLSFDSLLLNFEDYIDICDLNIQSNYILK